MHLIALDLQPASNRGGQEKSLFDILTGLRDLGVRITLLHVLDGDLLPKYREKGIECVRISRISIMNKLSPGEVFGFLASVLRVWRLGGDVFYINQIVDAPIAVAAKMLGGIRRVICHLRLPPLVDCGQVRMSIPKIDRFIVANRLMKRLHVEKGVPEEKVDIIPNGFWMDRIPKPERGKAATRLRIAYLGRFHEVKGLDVLLRALGKVHGRGIGLLLEIGGAPLDEKEEDYKHQMQQLAESVGISDSVKWIGFVSNPVSHLAGYDLTVFPSQWDEPFGRVMVESIVAGTPVIASHRGSSREILDEESGDWIFENEDELADLITKFAVDRSAYPIAAKVEFVRSTFDLKNILPQIQAVLAG